MEILQVLRTNLEESKKIAALERTFQEEKDREDENRHKEFIEVLKQFVSLKPVESEKKEEETSSFLEKIKKLFSDLSDGFKKVLQKITSLMKYVKVLSLGLGTMSLIVLGIYGASRLLKYFVDKMPDLSIINPQQALGVLESGSAPQIDYFASKVPKEFVEKLKKEKGKDTLTPKEILDEFVRSGGLTPPDEPVQMQTVPPRPPATGSGARAMEWDRKFSATHNPDGTPKSSGGARALLGPGTSSAGAGRGNGTIEADDAAARRLESSGQTGAVFGRYPSSGARRPTTSAAPPTMTPLNLPMIPGTEPEITNQAPPIIPSINPRNEIFNDATQQNNELMLNMLMDNQNNSEPVSIRNNGNSVLLPDIQLTVEADQRDDTPIFSRIMERYKRSYV